MNDRVRIRHTAAVVTGADIRAARERAGWSQKAFALEVGCSVAGLRKIENDLVEPGSSRLRERAVHLLSLARPGQGGDADPPLSQATKLQLADALYRVISEEEAAHRATGEVEDFDVHGRDLLHDHDVKEGVTRSGDDPPPTGVVQS